jgi:hypothetical protein
MLTVDSYTESTTNKTTVNAEATKGVGQVFRCNTTDVKLYSASFYLAKYGSPSGSAVVKLYDMSGTYGTSGIPTGSPLATSNPFDVSALSTGFAWYEFTFNQNYALEHGEYYAVTVEYNNGDGSNYLSVGTDTTSSLHTGNASHSSDLSSWTAYATFDLCFEVIGEEYILHFLEEPQVNIQAPSATHVKVKSPTNEYTANNSPASGHEVYQLVEIDEGNATVCQNIAEQLIARWGAEQKSVTGKIPLNLTLDLKQKIHVQIAEAGIDEEMILQKKEHDLNAGTTTLTLGDIILDDAELIARIIDDLI